jgi:hypothetical protein
LIPVREDLTIGDGFKGERRPRCENFHNVWKRRSFRRKKSTTTSI